MDMQAHDHYLGVRRSTENVASENDEGQCCFRASFGCTFFHETTGGFMMTFRKVGRTSGFPTDPERQWSTDL